MKPGIIYRGQIKDNQATDPHGDNILDPQEWLVHILDNGTLIDDSATEQFIEFKMAGEPIKPFTLNNEEDKFSPILETKVELRVHTDDNVNINTFAGGDDNRWEVKIWLASQIVHCGFLKMDDIQQDFMPDPNELLLVSSDNLDSLKDIPLTDDDENTIEGYNRIIHYISNALKKTGLSLEIKVINNIREADTATFVASDATFVTGPNQIGTFEGPSYFAAGKKIKVSGTTSNNGVFTINSVINSSPTITLNIDETLTTEIATNVVFNDAEGHYYQHEYLEAKTFESGEIGVSHNCNSVLEKILGEHCRIFQHWGQWWIVSTDELDENDLFIFTFDPDGEFDPDFEQTNFNKAIGLDNEETIFFINEDAIVKPTIPHKYIKETFSLTPPIEIICNIDLSRGALIAEFIGYKTYVLEDWLLNKDFPTGGTPASEAYIQKNFNDLDVEEGRFAILTPEASTSESNIQTCAIPVGENDIFDFGFDWSFSADVSNTGPYTRRVAIIRIVGDDGTYWTLDNEAYDTENKAAWVASNVTWTVGLNVLKHTIDTADDQEKGVNSFSVRCDKIPASGDMYVHIMTESESRYNVNVYISNISLDYHFFIGNAYRPVRAQYNKITSQTANNKVKREKEVFISDSPRKIFKGTLAKFDGDDFILTEGFFKWNIYFETAPPEDQIKTLGEWQAWWVWNQFRLCNREFDFTAQGIDSNALITTLPNPISPLHKYFLTDADESTNGRHFMLLHHEADVFIGEWTGFLSEVYNELEGKDYGSRTITSDDVIIGRWVRVIYNTGGGDITVYYLDVPSIDDSGYYKENTPSVPPFPSDVDLDADFTYIGGGAVSDIATDLGITMAELVSVTFLSDTSTVTTTTSTTFITAVHEFNYI